MGKSRQGLVNCDICQQTISIYFPLHSCEPALDQLVRLIPNYENMPTEDKSAWITSILHAIGSTTRPEWYDDHKVIAEKLVNKYGQHLINQRSESIT